MSTFKEILLRAVEEHARDLSRYGRNRQRDAHLPANWFPESLGEPGDASRSLENSLPTKQPQV